MNAVEKKIRTIAVTIINVQMIEGVAEAINRIVVGMDGYSEEVNNYLKGMYEFIDSDDRAFSPLTDEQLCKVQNIGARLLLNRENIVVTFIRLHHILNWTDGDDAMIALSDKLEIIAEKEGYPAVKYDD